MHHARPIVPLALFTAIGIAAGAATAQPDKPATSPPAKEPAPAKLPPAPGGTKPSEPKPEPRPEVKPAASANEYSTAEELLTALEAADLKIRTISAEIYFTTVASEAEGRDMQRRMGSIYFRNKTGEKDAAGKPAPESNAAACVKFDTLFQSNKQFPERKTYIVNRVAIERIEDAKLVNRFQIAKDGQEQDLLKLGEGPFPLPFGQSKADVMARFEASLAPSLESLENVSGHLRERLASTYQLRLVPKPGAGVAPKVKEVRVWYQKADLLPALARILRPDGGFDEFFLVGIHLNKPLPEGIFDTKVPAGWKVENKERP